MSHAHCALMKLKIIISQFSGTYVTSGITLDMLILALNNAKHLKKGPLTWYFPNFRMEIPFSTLSNIGLQTVVFGG